MRVTILIPTLDEEKALPATIAALRLLDPPADELLLVDGGSADATIAIARGAGLRVLAAPSAGRAVQINFGVENAVGDIVCVLHADSFLPEDGIAVIRHSMADPRRALASFTPRIAGPGGTRWFTTVHNWAKTWYAPLLLRPHLFVRGVRLLFGDHAMFFRRADFLAVGGCDPGVAIMEEADLCIKLARLGSIGMVARWVWTSDRRIAAWGPVKANWIFVKVGVMWSFGARARLGDMYPPIR
ncbi:MAG: glycosyltransferase [Sphingomonas sp.]|jgi:glycosyltransferase involved in cell wall biosynthesis